MEMRNAKHGIEIVDDALAAGIYSLPVVGMKAAQVRQFFDGIAPLATDSFGVLAAKNTLRYGTVATAGIGAAALTAMVVL